MLKKIRVSFVLVPFKAHLQYVPKIFPSAILYQEVNKIGDRDWGDGGMSEVVQQQFQLTRKDELMKAFVKNAISKVVQPMKDSWEEELETVAEDDW